jgi:hypothetical protein
MAETDLVATLVAIQRASGWTDVEMGRRLGISGSMWTLIRQGRRRLGGKALSGVLGAFPPLKDAVARYLDRGPAAMPSVTA